MEYDSETGNITGTYEPSDMENVTLEEPDKRFKYMYLDVDGEEYPTVRWLVKDNDGTECWEYFIDKVRLRIRIAIELVRQSTPERLDNALAEMIRKELGTQPIDTNWIKEGF